MNINDYIAEVCKKAHIENLSKAKTAKVDGVEMTVLPYGYLSQILESELLKALETGKAEGRQEMLEEVQKSVHIREHSVISPLESYRHNDMNYPVTKEELTILENPLSDHRKCREILEKSLYRNTVGWKYEWYSA